MSFIPNRSNIFLNLHKTLHTGNLLLYIRSRLNRSKSHFLPVIKRIILPQAEDPFLIRIIPFNKVIMDKVSQQQVRPCQSDRQADHGDEEKHFIPPPPT